MEEVMIHANAAFSVPDIGKILIGILNGIYDPIFMFSTVIFIFSCETILILKILHPRLRWFLQIYGIIDLMKWFVFPFFCSNIYISALQQHVTDTIYYVLNMAFMLAYCYITSRLIVRNRASPLWKVGMKGTGIFPSMIQERAGGYSARNQFSIALARRDYLTEATILITVFNISMLLIQQYHVAYLLVLVITDSYVATLAFFSMAKMLPFQRVDGILVHPDIILVKRGICRDYIAMLRMKSIDMDPSSKSDARSSEENDDRVTVFFKYFVYKWFYLLQSAKFTVSLNSVVGKDSYDLYIILKKKAVFTKMVDVLDTLASAMMQISASMNADLRCRMEIMYDQDLLAAMHELGFLSMLTKRFLDSRRNELSSARKGKPIFISDGGFMSLLTLSIEKLVRSHPFQKFTISNYMNYLIKALLSEKITARFIFTFKSSNIEKIDSNEWQNKNASFHGKIRDGFIEVDRNFEYLINNARISAAALVQTPDMEGHVQKVERVKGIITSLWEVDTKLVENKFSMHEVLACDAIDSFMHHVPSFILYRFFHVPTISTPRQERQIKIQLENPPDSIINSGLLNIGNLVDASGSTKSFMLNITDLKRHVFVNGTTGSGKSVFMQNLVIQLMKSYPTLPFLLIELKGEYSWLERMYPRVKFYEPGRNFSLNLFEPSGDVHVHTERVFDIIKTSFDFSDLKDFSPQMEKVLVDLITMTCINPDPAQRTFSSFFTNAQKYMNTNKGKIPFLENTWIGIENRIRRLTSGPLRPVFEAMPGQISPDTILNSQSVISLSHVINSGGTKADLYFISNLLLKLVWDANIKRGPRRDISHVTIVDDSQYFSKSRGAISGRETNYLEDLALLLRGTGEVLITLATRPDISEDVLSNCGLIVCFQTKFKDDIEKLRGPLHLPENQSSLLEILPEHTSIVKVNSYPNPFMIKTLAPFHNNFQSKELAKETLEEISGKTTDYIRKKKEMHRTVKLEELLGKEGKPNFGNLPRFFRLVEKFFKLKDQAWRDFARVSGDEFRDLNKEISLAREEIDVMISTDNDIRSIMQHVFQIKPRNDLLCKLYEEMKKD